LQTSGWKPQTSGWKPQSSGWKRQTSGRKSQTSSWKLQSSSWKWQTSSWKLGISYRNPKIDAFALSEGIDTYVFLLENNEIIVRNDGFYLSLREC
jgi:hypothetical protein